MQKGQRLLISSDDLEGTRPKVVELVGLGGAMVFFLL